VSLESAGSGAAGGNTPVTDPGLVRVSPIGVALTGLTNYGYNYGPDTPGTTTQGIQEALNTGAHVLITMQVFNGVVYGTYSTSTAIFQHTNNQSVWIDEGVFVVMPDGTNQLQKYNPIGSSNFSFGWVVSGCVGARLYNLRQICSLTSATTNYINAVGLLVGGNVTDFKCFNHEADTFTRYPEASTGYANDPTIGVQSGNSSFVTFYNSRGATNGLSTTPDGGGAKLQNVGAGNLTDHKWYNPEWTNCQWSGFDSNHNNGAANFGTFVIGGTMVSQASPSLGASGIIIESNTQGAAPPGTHSRIRIEGVHIVGFVHGVYVSVVNNDVEVSGCIISGPTNNGIWHAGNAVLGATTFQNKNVKIHHNTVLATAAGPTIGINLDFTNITGPSSSTNLMCEENVIDDRGFNVITTGILCASATNKTTAQYSVRRNGIVPASGGKLIDLTTNFAIATTTQYHVEDNPGFNPQGYATVTPGMPLTGVNQRNIYPYPVKVYFTGGLGTATSWTLTDIFGNQNAYAEAPVAGAEITLLPDEKIRIAYPSGTPTWVWRGQ